MWRILQIRRVTMYGLPRSSLIKKYNFIMDYVQLARRIQYCAKSVWRYSARSNENSIMSCFVGLPIHEEQLCLLDAFVTCNGAAWVFKETMSLSQISGTDIHCTNCNIWYSIQIETRLHNMQWRVTAMNRNETPYVMYNTWYMISYMILYTHI